MRRGFQAVACCLAGFALAVLILGASVQAHTGSFWYTHQWQPSIQTAGLWLYASYFMGAEEVSRVKDAFRQWNDQPPTLWYNYKGYGNYAIADCTASQPRNRNQVAWTQVDWVPAAAAVCLEPDNNEIDRFSILLDPDWIWFTKGQADLIEEWMVDMWGTLTHEYGHGLGFGVGTNIPDHFVHQNDSSDPCPGNDNFYQSTMCGDNIFTGEISTYKRTLELHDRHTFDAAYP